MTAGTLLPQAPLFGGGSRHRPPQHKHSQSATGTILRSPSPDVMAQQQHHQQQQSQPHSIFAWMDTCAANLFGDCDGQRLHTSVPRNEALHALDYSQLHDHFLESLLREASEAPTANSKRTRSYPPTSEFPEDSDSSGVESLNRKSRASRKFRRQRSLESAQSTEDVSKPYDPNAPPPIAPEHFLHDHVRMQKDKGRGVQPGSLICAKGQDECLEKFRVKMRLLCTTAIQEKGASMKRRPARVATHLDNFVETRSILEVRLGFLSMMYGVLLRWDTRVTGKITLVVLRKMCHESFYPREAVPPLAAASSSGSSENESEVENFSPYAVTKERSAPRVVDGRAIVDWPDGTEVTILEPPFLITRPESFAPSRLQVKTLHGDGLDRRSNWTVQFSLDKNLFSTTLMYDQARKQFVPKSSWETVSYDLEAMDTCLDVSLFQVRPRRKKCVSTMQIPLSNLPIQKDPPTHISFPFNKARIEMDVVLESDYLEWAQKEMEARRKASNFFWPRSSEKVASKRRLVDAENEEDDDEDDVWGWILCHSLC